jgi:hypothetical protein
MKANSKTDFTIESVRETYEKVYNRNKISPMQKIRLKAWLYHSESRHKNGNSPFHFNNYIHALGKQTYLEYIDFGLIDCEDLGGKEKTKEIINNWYR